MRARLIVPLTVTLLALSVPSASADPNPAIAALHIQSQVSKAVALTKGFDELLGSASRAPRDRAPRPSRQYERGGAPLFGDSGHPVWRDVPRWVRSFGKCVRHHESINAGHYRAENPVSSASGAYQFIDGTWRNAARWATWNGQRPGARYSRASSAPAWVQDVVFARVVQHGGQSAWRGTHCGYGT